MTLKLSALFGCILFLLYSCEKIQSYPPEPKLSYNSHKVEIANDALGNKSIRIEVKIDFIDGDGDMIIPFYDTTGLSTIPYSKLYTLFYQKKSGIYELIPSDSAFPNPEKTIMLYEDFMARDGQNKTFKGTITKYITRYNPEFDTLKLGFYVIDRAYHQSNILEIPDIALVKK